MSRNRRILISVACFAALFGPALYLPAHGTYGWTLFVMLPVVAGGLGTWSMQPRTMSRAALVGTVIGMTGCALFLLAGREGFICVLMALPIVVPLTIMGSTLAYWAGGLESAKKPAAMCLLLPVSLLFDVNAKPPVYSVTTSIVVNAPPERVWRSAVAFPENYQGYIHPRLYRHIAEGAAKSKRERRGRGSSPYFSRIGWRAGGSA